MKKQTIKTEEVVVDVVTITKKQPGRPVVEGSKRQLELQMKAELKANGIVGKKGRPIVGDSKRQNELMRKQQLREAGLLTGKKGRPVNPNSKKQLEFQRKETLRAQCLLKLGRPKVVKTEE